MEPIFLLNNHKSLYVIDQRPTLTRNSECTRARERFCRFHFFHYLCTTNAARIGSSGTSVVILLHIDGGQPRAYIIKYLKIWT